MNKKKKMLTLVALLVVLALAGVLTVILLKNKKSNEPEETMEESVQGESLISVNPEDITTLSFVSEGYDEIDAVKENGAWKLLQDEACPVDQDRLNSMARAITKIKADKILDTRDEEGMRFNAPEILVKFTANGEETEVRFGKKNATGDSYYTMISGDDKAYLVGDSIRFSFNRNISDLVYVEELPVFSELWIKKFDIISDGKEQVFTYYEREDDDGSLHPAYQNLSGIPTSTNMIDAFLYKLEDIRLKKCLDYNVSKEDLENKYGFSNPNAAFFLDYEDKDGQVGSFGLLVGDVAYEETDLNGVKTVYRYAMLQNLNIIYAIDESKYAEMMTYVFNE